MAGEIQLNSTTMATESSGTITLSNVNSATNRTNLGLGSIATQAADSVSISGGNITGGTIGSGVTFPAGHILQVQYTQFTSTAVMTSIGVSTDYVICDGTAGSGTEILTVDITPISTSSKIWIQAQWVGMSDDASVTGNAVFFLFRDSSKLSHSTAGNRNVGIFPMAVSVDGATLAEPQSTFFQYFDTPSTTSQITYKVGFNTSIGSSTLYTNTTVTDSTDNAFRERGISSISAIEIAG